MTEPLCRFCRAPLRLDLIDFGLQPLSNSYLTRAQLDSAVEATYPLHARVCENCWLVQVEDAVPSHAIFDDAYAYFSSYSSSWVAHAKRYAEAMARRFHLGPSSLVAEVASNDGYLLQHFAAMDIPVLGIEPTANTAAAAADKGIPTLVAFFNASTGRSLALQGVAADLMAANNVLAHVPDIADFVAGFQHVLRPEGVVTFEFPHLLQLIELVQFDTIYHEHYSYLSLLAVEAVLAANGLRAFDVEELATHGGSLRLFCSSTASSHPETQAIRDIRDAERTAGLDSPLPYTKFSQQAAAIRDDFLTFLDRVETEGKSIAAYGAAAKGNTFLNYANISAPRIRCVFDANPHKQGRYLPGSHVPILAPAEISKIRPDYLVILPWNLREEIIEQTAEIRDWGGRFVIAMPKLEILD